MTLAAAAQMVFVIVAAVLGAATGWCLRSGGGQRKSSRAAKELRYARDALARLHELTTNVAADVGEHSNRMEQINEELLSGGANETEAVVSAISKLVEANGHMQAQLASADQRLREQARQIESNAVEARTDALTGLANRRAFDGEMARRFAEYLRHGRTFSVAMIDVDHFKRFNDTHGHQAGDAVLGALARVLHDCAREMDLVARYGGEEFAIVLPGTPVADGGSAAERVRKAIEESVFRFEETDLHVTVSLGVAELQAGEDVPTLIRRADMALYASKQAGRNRVSLHDATTTEVLREAQLVTDQVPENDAVEDEELRRVLEAATAEESADGGTAGGDGPGELDSAEGRAVDRDGLLDRAALEGALANRLGQWRCGGRPPAVVLVGIDRYDEITSVHGEKAGELAMQSVLELLRAGVSNLETLVRYGRGTFAVLLRAADLAATVGIAERVREGAGNCSLSAEAGQLQFSVSVSAAAAADGDNQSRLLGRAEEALDAAQRSGGNCSYFHNGQWSEIAQAALQETV